MANQVLSFFPKEQNLLRFPSTESERRNNKLHRMLDRLADIGKEELVLYFFEKWLSNASDEIIPMAQADPDSDEKEPEARQQLTEKELLAMVARYPLPEHSAIVDDKIIQLYAEFRKVGLWPRCEGLIKTSIFVGDRKYKTAWGPMEQRPKHLEVLDGLGIKRIYVSSNFKRSQTRDNALYFRGAKTAKEFYADLCKSAAEFNFKKLSGYPFNQAVQAVALDEIEHQLESVSRRVIAGHKNGPEKERAIFTRFASWKAEYLKERR